jgi:hypothetical protein
MAVRKKVESRKLALPVIGLAALLVSGIVYAAASGTLSFTGTVDRNSNCKLNIEAATNVNPDSTILYQLDGSVIATVDAATRNTLSFSTDLDFQAPAKEITFQVQNVGNCTQVLGQLSITGAPSNGVIVNWPNLDGIVLAPGESTGTRTISVEWASNGTATTTETMSATVNYTEQ